MSMSDAELKKVIMAFRVTDLQVLLSYTENIVNQVEPRRDIKHLKKNELQKRALELIKLHSPQVIHKVKELQNTRKGPAKTPFYESQDSNQLGSMNPSSIGSSSYGNSRSHDVRSSRNHSQDPRPYLPLKSYGNSRPPANVLPYAFNPDVKFKDLPFFDILGELLRPSTLMSYESGFSQERDFVFHFTPHQALELQRDNEVKVLFRICLLQTNCDQEDSFPTNICVLVNKKPANLPNPIPTNKPGVDPKRPSRPVDITLLCRLTATVPNEIHVNWSSKYGLSYVIAVYLVRRLSSAILVNRLKSNGVRNPDFTTAMIKEKLCQDRDSEIATMSLRGSLICPLGKIRMILPCRAITCSHLKCFDASLYVQMNEKKPKWLCPVCDKPALFKDLAIDGLFLDITSKVADNCTEVQFHEDGSWTPVLPALDVSLGLQDINSSIVAMTPTVKEKPKATAKEPTPIDVINLDSDSDTEDAWPIVEQHMPPAKKMCRPVGTIPPNNAATVPTTALTENITNSLTSDKVNYLTSKPANVNVGSLIPSTSAVSDNFLTDYGIPGMTNFDLFSLIQDPDIENISSKQSNNEQEKRASDKIPDVISIDD